jgi:D-arabinose 1-dehydrogenase-like Zn-dependent alcohol dehydrogenase
MDQMNAAVVTSFDEPPHYQPFAVPQPTTPDEVLVDVLAVGLHPRVRSGASGAHYTSSGTLPMIPGIDGVAQRPDGKRIYFVAGDDVIGTMAERAVVDVRRSIELPDDVDVAKIAAAMNPAMSAWVALRRRVVLEPGQSVLVLGATGNAGTMAVQVAKRLGAGKVIGAGRDRTRLEALPADDVVQLTAVLSQRADRSRAMNWIQIGAMAGPTIELPSVALRSANFRLQGNGQGAVSTRVYLAELPSLVAEIDAGTIAVTANSRPLADVEQVWDEPDVPGERTVLVP